MFPITRLFESEQAAHEAINRLVEGEEPRSRSLVINPLHPDARVQLDAAIDDGAIMPGHRNSLMSALGRNRYIVSSRPFALHTAKFVEMTLEATAVDAGAIVDYVPDNPAPFSEFLGLPVLIESRSNTELFKFDKDSSFGINLISHKSTPLSSLFGLPLLKRPKSARGTSIQRMSGTSAWLSSKIGLPLLKQPKSARGSSVERLSGNAAPFSKFMGLPVLSRRR